MEIWISNISIIIFSDMDPLEELGSLQRQKSGQSKCPNRNCDRSFNNRAKPPNCDKCGAFLGGSFKPKEKTIDAKILASSIVSVRQNLVGVHTRVFVDLKENKVC